MEEEGTEMGETEVLVANFYTVSTSNGKQMKKWMEVSLIVLLLPALPYSYPYAGHEGWSSSGR